MDFSLFLIALMHSLATLSDLFVSFFQYPPSWSLFIFFRGVDGYLLAMVSLGRKLFLLKFSVLARVRIGAQCWPW